MSLEYSFKCLHLVSRFTILENIRVFSIESVECFWILPKIFIVIGRFISVFVTKITIYLGIYQCWQKKNERLCHKGPFYYARGAGLTWYKRCYTGHGYNDKELENICMWLSGRFQDNDIYISPWLPETGTARLIHQRGRIEQPFGHYEGKVR